MELDDRFSIHALGLRMGSAILLDALTAGFQAGTLTAILGPNGAGKSTLLKTLCGDLRPSTGSVLFGGRPVHSWEPRALARHRAVLPQSVTVPFEFTAREIVLLGRAPHGDFRRWEPQVPDFMDRTDTAHLANRTVTTLSGGELQRVNLARVLLQLAGQPPRQTALLLDEPTASLDPLHQHTTLQIARNVAQDGACVLVVLHDLNLAAQYADRLILMKHGRIVADGNPAAVIQPPLMRDVFGVLGVGTQHPIAGSPAIFFSLVGEESLRQKIIAPAVSEKANH